MALTSIQSTFTSYFLENSMALEGASKFDDSLMPGEVAILLQLLCLVPKKKYGLRIKPNLANGKVSLESLTAAC